MGKSSKVYLRIGRWYKCVTFTIIEKYNFCYTNCFESGGSLYFIYLNGKFHLYRHALTAIESDGATQIDDPFPNIFQTVAIDVNLIWQTISVVL